MIVYRFERNGIGPYVQRSGIAIGSFVRSKPTTRTQKKYKKKFDQYILQSRVDRTANWYEAHKTKEYMYGCSSKEQLRAYFGGNFKPLFQQGFRIKRYKVPDNEVIDMSVEVAFPVKYHKLQSVKKVMKVSGFA